jgi:hypothetical protein
VRQLQELFATDWFFATDENLGSEAYFPPLKKEGDVAAHIVQSGPDMKYPVLYEMICAAIYSAHSSVRIMTPYFFPVQALIVALRTAWSLLADRSAQAMHGGAMAIERLIDEMDLIKREALPIVAGVLIDKAQLLSGQPTQIHGQPDAPQDWSAARDAIRQARGRVIDIPAGTGLIPEDAHTKGEPAREHAPAPAELPEPMPHFQHPELQTPDSQSPVSLATGKDSGRHGHAAGHDVLDATRPPGQHGTPTPTRSQPGGGGGRSASDDAELLIDSGAETFEAKENPL